jgi:hypothetical protein
MQKHREKYNTCRNIAITGVIVNRCCSLQVKMCFKESTPLMKDTAVVLQRSLPPNLPLDEISCLWRYSPPSPFAAYSCPSSYGAVCHH